MQRDGKSECYQKDDKIVQRVFQSVSQDQLGCADAIRLAEELGISPKIIGNIADQFNIRLVKCRLGLFGYQPQKKIVKPCDQLENHIKDLLFQKIVENMISCAELWEIAKQHDISKISLSNYCDFLRVKIRTCQLGAFK